MLQAIDGKLIGSEFEHFKIPFPENRLPVQSSLYEGNEFLETMNEWLPNRRFQLLYKASVDGYAASDFHRACDNKGPTLTLIRSKNGFVFGGYSVLPFDSTTNGYKNHSEGFIFTLSNPHNIPPTKYPRKQQSTFAIFSYSTYGPTFGNGHDIYVANNSNQNSTSYTNFPYAYEDSTGKGQNTFTGAKYFTTTDIEVVAVI